MPRTVGALLLAAGYGRRFGGDKLLAPLSSQSGANLVFEQTLARLSEAIDEIVVVTRPELAPKLQPLIARGASQRPGTDISLLSFDQASRGMGASLAFAARHLPRWDGTLICLADMPHILTQSYAQLASAGAHDNILIPVCEGQRGHPVFFGSDYFPALRELTGDSGARSLLQKYSARTLALDLGDSGILLDIDTPEDLSDHT